MFFQSESPQRTKFVVNIHRCSCEVYIGRGSSWGNPWAIGNHGTRHSVLVKYAEHLVNQVFVKKLDFVEELSRLYGKVLGCYCSPKACHGHLLVEASIWAVATLEQDKCTLKQLNAKELSASLNARLLTCLQNLDFTL